MTNKKNYNFVRKSVSLSKEIVALIEKERANNYFNLSAFVEAALKKKFKRKNV